MSANEFFAQSSPQSIGATSIPSSESFDNQDLLASKHLFLVPINTRESFPTNSTINKLARNIYPEYITSSEYITNNHLFNGIQPTIRIIQQYSINSLEVISSNNSFALIPTPTTIKASRFIKSWVAIVNSMIVNVSKKNILDVDTLIEHQRIAYPQSRHIINSYIKTNKIKVDYYEKYTTISFMDSEEIDMARQTNNNLESYIKQKYHIESYFVNENINIPKFTRYKIENIRR